MHIHIYSRLWWSIKSHAKFLVIGTWTTTQLLETMRGRPRRSTSDSSCKRHGRQNYTLPCTCSFPESLVRTYYGESYTRLNGAPATLTWNKEKRNRTLEKCPRNKVRTRRIPELSIGFPFLRQYLGTRITNTVS